MKRGITTLVLLVVALGLGAYIYFVESKRKPAAERVDEKAKVFSGLDAATVEELEVKASGGDLTKLKKENGAWRIVAPITSGVDESEVSGITSNLGSLEVQRVVDEQPADVAQYGLAPARTEIGFRTAGQGAPRRLLLGEKTATGGDLYAKLASEPRVFLVSGFLDTTFNRSTFDLRDKTVLRFDRDKVTTVELTSPDRTITFAKEGDTWKIAAPQAVRADYGTVEGLVGRIATGQMKSLVADAPQDLAQYGLQKPERSVTLLAGSARSTLLLGSKTPEGQFYAKDAARPLVFTVEAFLTEDFGKTVDDFRPKDLYEFRTFTGTRFEIVREGVTTVFEKTKGTDASAPEAWAQTQPKPAKPIESTRVEDFLSKMSNLRAEAFAEAVPAGATEAARTTARWSDGKREESVTYFKSGTDVFAVRSGETGAARLGASSYEDAVKALDALK
jgi:hypothetical protein